MSHKNIVRGVVLCFMAALLLAMLVIIVMTTGTSVLLIGMGVLLCAGLLYTLATEFASNRTLRKSTQQAQLNEEQYKAVFERSDDIVFEWNLKTEKLYVSPKWYEIFGDPPTDGALRDPEHKAIYLHPDERHSFGVYTNEILAGRQPEGRIVRMKSKTGKYIWCKTRSIMLYDKYGVPDRVIGYIIDVTKEQQEKKLLQLKAQKDSLTQLYNHATAESLINAYIEKALPEDLAALLIIDIDDFKRINDTYGHPAGDEALRAVAQRLHHLFRITDVVARIGGDEFCVFIAGIPDREFATRRAKDIMGAFHKNIRKDDPETPISCSIGISFFKEHGSTFNELYRQADAALYRAKRRGKNSYDIADGSGR